MSQGDTLPPARPVWGFSLFFSPLAGGCCPASGRGRLRGGRQGVRGAGPSTPPTTPILPCPCGGGRLCRMTCPLPTARRRGPSARIFPRCARAICAPAAALPLCGDRLRAPARWVEGIFPACSYSDGKHLLRHGERPMPREKEEKKAPTPCPTCLSASSAQRTESIKESLLPHLKRRLSPNLRKTDTTVLPV